MGCLWLTAQVGDVLRIGVRGLGTATYFGDAVITEIASATSCSIDKHRWW